CSVAHASAAKADVASIALEANARIDISKQRLRIFVSYSCSPDLSGCCRPAEVIRLRPALAGLRRKSRPGYNSNAHTKARFAPNDKQNSCAAALFCRQSIGKLRSKPGHWLRFHRHRGTI